MPDPQHGPISFALQPICRTYPAPPRSSGARRSCGCMRPRGLSGADRGQPRRLRHGESRGLRRKFLVSSSRLRASPRRMGGQPPNPPGVFAKEQVLKGVRRGVFSEASTPAGGCRSISPGFRRDQVRSPGTVRNRPDPVVRTGRSPASRPRRRASRPVPACTRSLGRVSRG